MNIKKIGSYGFAVLGTLALIAWFYFLLPVSPQSLLSADHVRWAYAASDFAPVLDSSLNSVWAILLRLMHAIGIGAGGDTFATAAALSAWIALAALLVLSRYVSKFVLVVVVLTPAVFWSSVVPNGTSVNFLVLALIGILASPEVTIEKSRTRWTFGAIFEGLGCALTPFAWPLAIARAFMLRKVSISKQTRLIRALLFLVGFSFPMGVAVLLDATRGSASSFALLPMFSSLQMLPSEDVLGAGRIMFTGGEVALAFFASLVFVLAILLAGWIKPKSRYGRILVSASMCLGLIASLVFGYPRSWMLAHPGWNTILEDFALNIDRSLSKPTVAIVKTSTEEAAIRYASALLEKKGSVVAVRAQSLMDAASIKRIQRHENKFGVEEMAAALKEAGNTEFKNILVEKLVVPNTARGVQFWLDFPPDRFEGLEIQFLPVGVRVSGAVGATKFLADREPLRNTYVRARPTLREWIAGPSLETEIFSRYAMYHIAAARIIEREKKTSDWERRARGEYYAALKKVEWLKNVHEKVCDDPKAEATSESSQATKSEPLDVCTETAWFYGT